MNQIWIGIDNGMRSGAAVALDAHGAIVSRLVLSVREHGGIPHVDAHEIYEWLRDLSADDWESGGFPVGRRHMHVALEAPPAHADSAQSLGSMERCYGAIAGLLLASEIRHPDWFSWRPVHSGNRLESWQRILLPEGSDTKKAALQLARELWPHETWLPSARHRMPHTGLIDAALIAHTIRLQAAGELPMALEPAKRKPKKRKRSNLVIGS